jgi:hypothetical protein
VKSVRCSQQEARYEADTADSGSVFAVIRVIDSARPGGNGQSMASVDRSTLAVAQKG